MGIAHFNKSQANPFVFADLTAHKETPSYFLFEHRELFSILNESPRINQKALVNIINHLNFIKEDVFLHLKNSRFKEDYLIPACPEPCQENMIILKVYGDILSLLDEGKILHLVILNGLDIIAAPVQIQKISESCLYINLPDKAFMVGKRKVRRYSCRNIPVDLIQDGFHANGYLIDFSSLALRVKVSTDTDSTFHWLNTKRQINIRINSEKQILFSGPCRFIRNKTNSSTGELVIAPLNNEIQRFQKKKLRSPRIKLQPTPYVTFCHPFFQSKLQREITDISINGFSIREEKEEAVLIPGMILPETLITIAGGIPISCCTQVIYRREQKNGYTQCGLVVLDMDVRSFGKISNILFNIRDPHVYVDNHTDMDSLWEFFFDANFIYPKKYTSIQSYRDAFAKTYEFIYLNNPEIAANITYKENGRIFGHVSMIKAYERAWMVHHLAARSKESRRIGLPMVKQIMYYFEGFYRLPSLKMDYWICYFRPDNKFMDYFFGGFARDLHNPRACSLDLYAYTSLAKDIIKEPLPDDWKVDKLSDRDLCDLETFYRNHSGGLLLNALNLYKSPACEESLEEIYARYGFLRTTEMFSLKRSGNLKAFIVANRSSPGLNLSELLNGFKIIVTDQEATPYKIIIAALSQIANMYEIDKIPLLVYPHSYLDDRGIPYEKKYFMLVMDMQYGNNFLEYMHMRIKRRYLFMIKYIVKKIFRI